MTVPLAEAPQLPCPASGISRPLHMSSRIVAQNLQIPLYFWCRCFIYSTDFPLPPSQNCDCIYGPSKSSRIISLCQNLQHTHICKGSFVIKDDIQRFHGLEPRWGVVVADVICIQDRQFYPLDRVTLFCFFEWIKRRPRDDQCQQSLELKFCGNESRYKASHSQTRNHCPLEVKVGLRSDDFLFVPSLQELPHQFYAFVVSLEKKGLREAGIQPSQ